MYIGDNLKQQREKNKKERKEVAADTKTNPETYRRYENNERKTPLDKREQYAVYFNITLEEMETGIAPEQEQTPPAQKVCELCKQVAAIKHPKELRKDVVVDLLKAGADWLGKGK